MALEISNEIKNKAEQAARTGMSRDEAVAEFEAEMPRLSSETGPFVIAFSLFRKAMEDEEAWQDATRNVTVLPERS